MAIWHLQDVHRPEKINSREGAGRSGLAGDRKQQVHAVEEMDFFVSFFEAPSGPVELAGSVSVRGPSSSVKSRPPAFFCSTHPWH